LSNREGPCEAPPAPENGTAALSEQGGGNQEKWKARKNLRSKDYTAERLDAIVNRIVDELPYRRAAWRAAGRGLMEARR